MSKAIADVIKNTKDIFMADSSLNSLLDFERVLDELDLYVFANWKEGELVEGPVYEKYFVTCTFMWPYKLMPDPRGGELLLDYDCEVYYSKDLLEYPVKITTPDDFKPGTKMPKMKKTPVWLVKIVMPKKLASDIFDGYMTKMKENMGIGRTEGAQPAPAESADNAQVPAAGAALCERYGASQTARPAHCAWSAAVSLPAVARSMPALRQFGHLSVNIPTSGPQNTSTASLSTALLPTIRP
jgi:hypothetical protein